MSTNSSMSKIYKEKKDFILIGLTGRTGSGCSKVAEILSKENFSDLDLRDPKSYDFTDVEERKYSIIYEYAKANENWKPFKVIVMSSMITWFMIEQGYKEFVDYIKKQYEGKTVEFEFDKVENKIKEKEEAFNEINKKICQLNLKNKKKQNGIDDGNHENIKESHESIMDVYDDVHKLSQDIKAILKSFICCIKSDKNKHDTYSQLYTYLYQKIGNNIRSYGHPFKEGFVPGSFFSLAEKCNELIKSMRDEYKKVDQPTLICIDAIRNPFEASFFKDRYSAFYTISVNTDDDTRRKRLANSNFREDEIKSLDEREYAQELKSEEKFYNQNIGACLEIADIHIYNPEVDNNKYYFLTQQLLKYITLMIHPGIVTPTHLERCMQIAYNAKLNSGCLSRQVGAVVTNEDFAIKSVGWNEVPKGQISCSFRDIKGYCQNKDSKTYSFYEKSDFGFNEKMHNLYGNIDYEKLEGRKHPFCFKDVYNSIKKTDNQVYTRSLHAEENAFLQISKYGGTGVENGYLFTTASPCELCAKKAYHLGIKKIYYIDPYPGISKNHILNFGDSSKTEMSLFYGAIGNAYISLYTPKMPYKDELEMMTGITLKYKKEEEKETSQ